MVGLWVRQSTVGEGRERFRCRESYDEAELGLGVPRLFWGKGVDLDQGDSGGGAHATDLRGVDAGIEGHYEGRIPGVIRE